jgi:UDP-N-acetylglucosamine--N-acetylmuramyl-(pentapeptide) pyrophosphoryl-undecaprenol N-acetylglucosamine transferase
MRFVVTGGGTAGHINPALAVAQELRLRGHEVLYAGTPQGLESRLIPAEGITYRAFEAAGFNRAKPLTLLSSTLKIAGSTRAARAWLREVRPDAVLGFGGYVSIPVGLAASRLGIPLIIHEQNSTSGLANRFLAKRAAAVALTYPQAAATLSTSGSVHHTGNPLRASLFAADRDAARVALGFAPDALVLLVFGGSLGAQHINQALVALAPRLMALPDLQVFHIAGKNDYDATLAALREQGIDPATDPRWQLRDYFDRMGEALVAADLVLSRSGATSLAEFTALGVAALLVPFPHAAADEQTSNAQTLVDGGAAAMLADAELDSPRFAELLFDLLADEPRRRALAQAARARGNTTAAATIAQLAIDAAAL